MYTHLFHRFLFQRRPLMPFNRNALPYRPPLLVQQRLPQGCGMPTRRTARWVRSMESGIERLSAANSPIIVVVVGYVITATTAAVSAVATSAAARVAVAARAPPTAAHDALSPAVQHGLAAYLGVEAAPAASFAPSNGLVFAHYNEVDVGPVPK